MKKCILFSGGWDSVAVALMETKADLLFFNYGQTYFENELLVARNFAKAHRRNLIVSQLNLAHDIERRNFYLILEAKRLGYQVIYTGNRNVLPIFDKYKDSNWLTLKILGLISNLVIKMPIVAWGKKKIVKFVLMNSSIRPYNCYNNLNDFTKCECQNCREINKIFTKNLRDFL